MIFLKGIKRRRSHGLAAELIAYVFIVMWGAFIAVSLLTVILHYTGISENPFLSGAQTGKGAFWRTNPLRFVIPQLLLCPFVGMAIGVGFGRIILKPLKQFIEASNKIATGDFSVKIDVSGITELEELGGAFNKMTDELGSIQLLRSDFINNFSHELKTPIVSLRGFAKLIKDGSLSEDEKNEYLDIIVSESERLAELSTNILNLTKYETLDIITDKTEFKLDEQIRRAVLLTESKWSVKNISFDLLLEPIIIHSNEDMLQQIWLNLLDNAVKFSRENGVVTIRLDRWNGRVRFAINDDGDGLDEEELRHIFSKSYTMSGSSGGNGLGLAIVKRITELCGGEVTASGKPGSGSLFTVTL